MARTVQLVIIVFFLSFSLSSFSAEDSQVAIPRFDIKSYQVEGNTLIPAAKLASILAVFTGKDKDFGTVQEAIEALEKTYRDRGFSTVMVILPEQELQKGIVLLKVIESNVKKIDISGNLFFDQGNILRSLPALRQGEVPNLNAISRSLKLANENPAKKIDLQFKNSEKENEIDAAIAVKDEKPWKVGITADNTGDKDTGRTRMGVLLQHANLFNLDHLLSLQYMTSPENLNNVHIYSVGYHAPFYSWGSSVDLVGAYSDVNSGTVSAGSYSMNVSGKGTILGLHYNQNITRIGNYEHKVTLGVDYRAYENSVDLAGFQLGNNITVHPVSLTYAGTYTVEKFNAGFYLTGMQNLPGNWDGRGEESDFEKARSGAPQAYNMIRYGANMLYALPGDWQGRLVFNGQYTSDPLVPGEQYGIGGASSVRGFREREIINDKGYSGSVEIYTPNLGELFGIKSVQCRLLAFYDRGYVSRVDPLPGETDSTEIASVGPGIRITDGKYFTLSADLGFVVDPPNDSTSRWSSVWHVSASVMF